MNDSLYVAFFLKAVNLVLKRIEIIRYLNCVKGYSVTLLVCVVLMCTSNVSKATIL